MGFTSEQNASTGSATGDKYSKAPSGPSFGDRLGSYLESRFPVVGGIGEMTGVLPQQQAPIAHVDPSYGTSSNNPSIDNTMLLANAQPKSNGGLATILKLIAGA